MENNICQQLRQKLADAKITLVDFEKLLLAKDHLYIETKNKLLKKLVEVREDLIAEKFKMFSPKSKIEIVASDEVPANIMEIFEEQSHMFVHPKNFKKGNFIRFYIIHDSYTTIYVAEQDKIYDKGEEDQFTERLHYFLKNERVVDRQHLDELRFNMDTDEPYYKDKPFIYNSRSGIPRLKLMNAFSRARFGLVMHSNTSLELEDQFSWKQLVEDNLAEEYEEIGPNAKQTRYKFKE